MKTNITTNGKYSNDILSESLKKLSKFLIDISEDVDLTSIDNLDVQFNSQGWKIHVYANTFTCDQILQITIPTLRKYQLSYKFINDKNVLNDYRNKNADISFSGKFLTIYINKNEPLFKNIIEELYIGLKSFDSFKIIGDKNYKNSIINYRYGSYIKEKNIIWI
ncbi:hypothetical protein [Mycoplasma crocodyli]|uniref:class III lanthionine synthetase LanKC N-terminal domain-containing protein n=1 Tax=Mycoplasma crocodyli TaxID=50052 RepID=UPI000311A167|nr:hypothetical protein [Mycoplasma crocodyli]